MKHYLVKLCIETSGYEKMTHNLVQATTPRSAGIRAMEDEAHGDLEYTDRSKDQAEDEDGTFIYSVYSTVEVKPEHLEILKKYI
jgi:hypothetical protein